MLISWVALLQLSIHWIRSGQQWQNHQLSLKAINTFLFILTWIVIRQLTQMHLNSTNGLSAVFQDCPQQKNSRLVICHLLTSCIRVNKNCLLSAAKCQQCCTARQGGCWVDDWVYNACDSRDDHGSVYDICFDPNIPYSSAHSVLI